MQYIYGKVRDHVLEDLPPLDRKRSHLDQDDFQSLPMEQNLPIPEELFLHILNLLPARDILACSVVRPSLVSATFNRQCN